MSARSSATLSRIKGPQEIFELGPQISGSIIKVQVEPAPLHQVQCVAGAVYLLAVSHPQQLANVTGILRAQVRLRRATAERAAG